MLSICCIIELKFSQEDHVNTIEKIYKEVQALPETDAREVLDFVAFLKAKRSSSQAGTINMNEFDSFGAVFSGNFNRDECYDRKVLR